MLMKNSSSGLIKRQIMKNIVTFSDFDKYCRTLMATLRIAVLQQGGKEKKFQPCPHHYIAFTHQ